MLSSSPKTTQLVRASAWLFPWCVFHSAMLPLLPGPMLFAGETLGSYSKEGDPKNRQPVTGSSE